jgi:hypothetical protein
MIWARAVAAHPIAYAEHRLAHFNRATWFLVPENPDPPAWTQSVPNPWNFEVRPNWLLSSVDAVANGASRTPLGWPIFWIAVAFAVLILCRAAELCGEVAAIAASAFCYGTGYLILGVATGMRYHVWTITGAALASVLAAAELALSGKRSGNRATALAAATVGVPTLLTAFARLAF